MPLNQNARVITPLFVLFKEVMEFQEMVHAAGIEPATHTYLRCDSLRYTAPYFDFMRFYLYLAISNSRLIPFYIEYFFVAICGRLFPHLAPYSKTGQGYEN